MDLQRHELQERIAEGEGLHLDFKHSITDSGKIARSLAAYANTDGGSLLIGVRDNGSIAGVKSDEECYMIETAALLYTYPVVEYSTVNHVVDGKNVLEVVVARSEKLPHYAPDVRGDMRAFVRCADKNVLAPPELVRYWRQSKSYVPSELFYDDVMKFIVSEIRINGFVTKDFIVHFTGMSVRSVEDVLVNLMLMQVVRIEMDEKTVRFVFTEEYKNQCI
jgi:predicted HTH transcriptional regulator